MKLEQLRKNFLTSSEAEQEEIFHRYCLIRQRDLDQVVVKVPLKRAVGKRISERKIPVTPDQLELLRKIGLV